MAFLAAVLGLWLTWDRLESRPGKGSWLRPDRRLAESGRVARPRSTQPQLGSAPESGWIYIPHARTRTLPALPPDPARSPRLLVDAPDPSGPALLHQAPPASPSPISPSSSVSPSSAYPSPPIAPPSQARPAPPARSRNKPPTPPATRPTIPRDPPPERPEMPLPVAWAHATGCWGLLSDWRGHPRGSFTALPGGMAVAPLHLLEDMNTGQIHSPFGPMHHIAHDPDLGLAVFEMDRARTLPLASIPPRAGTELAAPAGFGSPGTFQPCVIIERLPSGLFLFRGNSLETSVGGPLVNRRQELVGVVLGRHPGYPGHDYMLAADASLLQALNQADPELPGRKGPVLEEVVRLLLRDVRSTPMEPQTRPRNRILPGTALGRFRLGVSREDLLAFLGPGHSRVLEGGFEHLSYPVYRLEFVLLQQRLVSIATTDPFFATSTGVGVGTPWEQARPGRELAGATRGPLPGGGQRVIAPGLELEVSPDGMVRHVRVTPR